MERRRHPERTVDVRAIAEAALLMDVTVVLSLLRVLVPVPGFSGLLRLACPLPFILLALRRGPRTGLVATVASFILLSCFVGPVVGTQILVFGGLGTLFAWASQKRIGAGLTVVMGGTLYCVFYLIVPFLVGVYALQVNLAQTLHDVQRQAGGFINGLGHLHVLSAPIGPRVVSALSASPAGRGFLDALHGLALTMLARPLDTLIAVFSLYSALNVWAYLVIGVELFYRLPLETRRNSRGDILDFFPKRRLQI